MTVKCHFWGAGQLTLNDNKTIHENSMFMTRVAAVLNLSMTQQNEKS